MKKVKKIQKFSLDEFKQADKFINLGELCGRDIKIIEAVGKITTVNLTVTVTHIDDCFNSITFS